MINAGMKNNPKPATAEVRNITHGKPLRSRDWSKRFKNPHWTPHQEAGTALHVIVAKLGKEVVKAKEKPRLRLREAGAIKLLLLIAV